MKDHLDTITEPKVYDPGTYPLDIINWHSGRDRDGLLRFQLVARFRPESPKYVGEDLLVFFVMGTPTDPDGVQEGTTMALADTYRRILEILNATSCRDPKKDVFEQLTTTLGLRMQMTIADNRFMSFDHCPPPPEHGDLFVERPKEK